MTRGGLALVYQARRDGVDAIMDYTRQLAPALQHDEDLEGAVRLVTRTLTGPWTVASADGAAERQAGTLTEAIQSCAWVILQYNPFSYGHWGFAPWLPRALTAMRGSDGVPRLAIMVHEPYVPMRDARTTLMGAWQRGQLKSIMHRADVVMASTEATARSLQRWSDGPIIAVSVGSNLPDRRSARAEQRVILGAEDDTLVLAAFGQPHPSRLPGHVVAAANAVGRNKRQVLLLNLGFAAPARLPGLDRQVELVTPGRLSDDGLACHLAATDLFLSPLTDGVSARRTSMIAALQHALPILGTHGPSTDAALRRASEGLLLVPSTSLLAFVRMAEQIGVASSQERSRMAIAARALYEERFAWPAVAGSVLRALSRREPGE